MSVRDHMMVVSRLLTALVPLSHMSFFQVNWYCGRSIWSLRHAFGALYSEASGLRVVFILRQSCDMLAGASLRHEFSISFDIFVSSLPGKWLPLAHIAFLTLVQVVRRLLDLWP